MPRKARPLLRGRDLTKHGREALEAVRTEALNLAHMADFVLRHPCQSNLATTCDAARDAKRVLAPLLQPEGGGDDDAT